MNSRVASAIVLLPLVAALSLGVACGRKSTASSQPSPSASPFAGGLVLDQSLERAVHDFVQAVEAAPSRDDLVLLRELAGSGANDLGEWLLEFLGLPSDDVTRVVAERTKAMGQARYQAAIHLLAAGLAKSGFQLEPAHLSVLRGQGT